MRAIRGGNNAIDSEGNIYNDEGEHIGYGETDLIEVSENETHLEAWSRHANGETDSVDVIDAFRKSTSIVNPEYVRKIPAISNLLANRETYAIMLDELVRSGYMKKDKRPKRGFWMVLLRTVPRWPFIFPVY